MRIIYKLNFILFKFVISDWDVTLKPDVWSTTSRTPRNAWKCRETWRRM